MDKNSNVEKFPFEYIIEPTSQNPDINLNIEIPWWDDEKHFLDQMKRDMIYQDEEYEIFDQLYENGFHALFIKTPNKLILKTNWELDEMDNGWFYLEFNRKFKLLIHEQ